MRRTAAILVLNYNGKDLLQECLPSVIRAAERAGPGNSVVVVDNASTDGSRESNGARRIRSQGRRIASAAALVME